MKLKTFEELKKKFPILASYLLMIIIFTFISSFVMPYFSFLNETVIYPGFTLYHALNVFFFLAVIFLIFEIWNHLYPILNFFIEKFYKVLPGSEKVGKRSIRRILYDIAYIIIVILIVTSIPLSLSSLFEGIGMFFNLIGLVIIFFLLFDIFKTAHFVLTGKIGELNQKLSKKK